MDTYGDQEESFQGGALDQRMAPERGGEEQTAKQRHQAFQVAPEASHAPPPQQGQSESTHIHGEQSAPSSRASSVSILGHELLDVTPFGSNVSGGEHMAPHAFATTHSTSHSTQNASDDMHAPNSHSNSLEASSLEASGAHLVGNSSMTFEQGHVAHGHLHNAHVHAPSTPLARSSITSSPHQAQSNHQAGENGETAAFINFLDQFGYNNIVGHLDILINGKNNLEKVIISTSETARALEEQLASETNSGVLQELNIRLAGSLALIESSNVDLNHIRNQLNDLSRRIHNIRSAALDAGHNASCLRVIDLTVARLDADLSSYPIPPLQGQWGLAPSSSQLPLGPRSNSVPSPASFGMTAPSTTVLPFAAPNVIEGSSSHSHQVASAWNNMPILSAANMLPPQTSFDLPSDFVPPHPAPIRHHSISGYAGASPLMVEPSRLRRSSVPELGEMQSDEDYEDQFLPPQPMSSMHERGRSHSHRRFPGPKTPSLPKVTTVQIDHLELVRAFIDDEASRYVSRISVVPYIRDNCYTDDEDMPHWSPHQRFSPPIPTQPLPPHHLPIQDTSTGNQNMQYLHQFSPFQHMQVPSQRNGEELPNWNQISEFLPPGSLESANGNQGLQGVHQLSSDHPTPGIHHLQHLQGSQQESTAYRPPDESGNGLGNHQHDLGSMSIGNESEHEQAPLVKQEEEMSGFEASDAPGTVPQYEPLPQIPQRKRSRDESSMDATPELNPEESPRVSKRSKRIESIDSAMSASSSSSVTIGNQHLLQQDYAQQMLMPQQLMLPRQLTAQPPLGGPQDNWNGMTRRSGLSGAIKGHDGRTMESHAPGARSAPSASPPLSPGSSSMPTLDLSDLAKPFTNATTIKPRYLAIGDWHEDASETVSIVAKFHHAKKKLIWEVHDASKGSSVRMTVHYGDVSAITVHDVIVGNASSASVAVNFSLNSKPKLECEAPTREHRHARTWVMTSAGWTLGEADKMPQLHTLIFEKKIFTDRHSSGISHFERLIIGDPYFTRIARIDSRYPIIAHGFNVVGRRTLEMLRDKLIAFFELIDLYVRIYSLGQLSLSINYDVHHTYKNTDPRIECGPHDPTIAVNFEDIAAIAEMRHDTIMSKDEINYYAIVTKVGENSICSFRQLGAVPTKNGGKLSPNQLVEFPHLQHQQHTSQGQSDMAMGCNSVSSSMVTGSKSPSPPTPARKKKRTGRAAEQPKNIRVAIMFSKARLMAVCGDEIEQLWIDHVPRHEASN